MVTVGHGQTSRHEPHICSAYSRFSRISGLSKSPSNACSLLKSHAGSLVILCKNKIATEQEVHCTGVWDLDRVGREVRMTFSKWKTGVHLRDLVVHKMKGETKTGSLQGLWMRPHWLLGWIMQDPLSTGTQGAGFAPSSEQTGPFFFCWGGFQPKVFS